MDTNQVYSVGDNGSTSIYRGLSLGSWSTSGGAALAPTTSVTLALTINDTANSGFAVYLNGYTTTVNSSTKLNTKNSAIGAEFDGPGDLIFAGTGSSGGSATVYTRVGALTAANNTSGGPGGGPTLVSFASSTGNLVGKTLNLQNLTFTAGSAQVLATNGTMSFGACSALYAPGITMSQGTFKFQASAIDRVDSDASLSSNALSFQPGAMVSVAYGNVNTNNWSLPSNVDLICSTNSTGNPNGGGDTSGDYPQCYSGTNSIVLGNGHAISSPWGPGAGGAPWTVGMALADSTQAVTITAAAGASSVRLAAANGNTMTINIPLNLPNSTLQINDTPGNTLYVPYDGDTNFQRQPGGSILNGTVVLANMTSTTPSTLSNLYVAGGTLQLGSPGALGATPVAMTVGAQTANAGTATFDLYGQNTVLSTPERLVGRRYPGLLWRGPPCRSTCPPTRRQPTPARSPAACSVNFLGPGTMILTGNNSNAGTMTISGGTLQVGNGVSTGTMPTGSIVNNSTLLFNPRWPAPAASFPVRSAARVACYRQAPAPSSSPTTAAATPAARR